MVLYGNVVYFTDLFTVVTSLRPFSPSCFIIRHHNTLLLLAADRHVARLLNSVSVKRTFRVTRYGAQLSRCPLTVDAASMLTIAARKDSSLSLLSMPLSDNRDQMERKGPGRNYPQHGWCVVDTTVSAEYSVEY